MLAFERHGSGEPLILVHGITHRRQAWYPVLDELAEQRDVILVDLPGHGQSPALVTHGRPVQDVLRAQFKAFLDEVGVERPHVAGNSLGGLIALMAGVEGDARTVTALSPAGFWRTPAQYARIRRIFTGAAAASARLGPALDSVPRSRAGRQLIYSLLTAHPSRVSRDQAVGDVRGFVRARPALHTLLAAGEPFTDPIPAEVPVTIAWAEHDRILPLRQAQVARERLPLATHLTMPGVGHVPMTDDPHQVAQVLLSGSSVPASVRRFEVPRRSSRARRTRAASA